MDEALIDRIAASTLRRRGLTWEPGATLDTQAKEAAAAALDLLRSFAGDENLSPASGALFDLAVVAAWYLMEQRRAEFLAEYKQELIWLRAERMVAYGDGDADVP